MGSTVSIHDLIEAVRDVTGPGEVTLHRPFIDKEDKLEASLVDPTGYDAIEAFERELAKLVGVKHAVAVSSGTAALHLALISMGATRGTVVGLPNMTFVAAAAASRYTGAYIWLGGDAVRTVGDHPEIAIMVDLLGDPNMAIERGDRVRVIEDAAAALGSRRDKTGRMCGAFGDVGILSFNNNKIITTGGGGAVLTDYDETAALVRHLASTAKEPSPFFFNHDAIGFNYRMGNMAAAVGLSQLKRLPVILEKKRQTHEAYAAALEGMDGVRLVEPSRYANHWLNAIRLMVPAQRDAVMTKMQANGIGVRALYTPLHRQKPYVVNNRRVRIDRATARSADAQFEETICLPSGRHN